MAKPTIIVTVISGTVSDGKKTYAVGESLKVDKADLVRLEMLGKVKKGKPDKIQESKNNNDDSEDEQEPEDELEPEDEQVT